MTSSHKIVIINEASLEVLNLKANKFIDHEDFANGHDLALKMREKRLDEEHEKALKRYEKEIQVYELELEKHKSKSLFKKLMNKPNIQPPVEPTRRV